ncbi:MAG: hypothetical protein QNI90_18875 [Dinoroseobacter sp.]|nr:hypothetical protein [Dinoroseobacter sp.]
MPNDQKPTDRYFDPMLPQETLLQISEERFPELSNLEWLCDRRDYLARERGHPCS